MDISESSESDPFTITPLHGRVITGCYTEPRQGGGSRILTLFVIIIQPDGEPVGLVHEYDVTDELQPEALQVLCETIQWRAHAIERGDQSRYDDAREALVAPSAVFHCKPNGI